jgi:DNA-binding PadR family transcriptional regulator
MGSPFASETELLILGLLLQKPSGMYGLDLVGLSGGELSRDTVYIALSRLEEQGFVKSRARPDAKHAGIVRRTYWIAAMGKRHLRETGCAHPQLAGATT